MKKINVVFSIVIAILIVLYNVLVFAIPFEKTSVFWIAYGFTLDAFVIAAVGLVIAFRNKNDLISKIYGYPIARIGVIYLFVQVLLSFLFMTLSTVIPTVVAIIVFAVLLAAAVIGLIATDSIRDHVENVDAKSKNVTSVIRMLQAKVAAMAEHCSNVNAAKALKNLSDELRFSDPVSSTETAVIESNLSAVIGQLQMAVNSSDVDGIQMLCKNATDILAERNTLCKLSK